LSDLYQRSLKSFESGESNAKQLLSVGEAPGRPGLRRDRRCDQAPAMSIVARAISESP